MPIRTPLAYMPIIVCLSVLLIESSSLHSAEQLRPLPQPIAWGAMPEPGARSVPSGSRALYQLRSGAAYVPDVGKTWMVSGFTDNQVVVVYQVVRTADFAAFREACVALLGSPRAEREQMQKLTEFEGTSKREQAGHEDLFWDFETKDRGYISVWLSKNGACPESEPFQSLVPARDVSCLRIYNRDLDREISQAGT